MKIMCSERDRMVFKILAAVCLLGFVLTLVACSTVGEETVKVGILHSQTGTLAASENPAADVDSQNQHLWKSVRIGQIKSDGQFDIVWDPGVLIPPRPFPKTRSPAEWQAFLEDLYAGWDGNWENRG